MEGYDIPGVYPYEECPASYLQPQEPSHSAYCPPEGYGEYYGLDRLQGDGDDGRGRRRNRHRPRRRSSASSASHSSSSSSSVSGPTLPAPELQAGDFREPSFLDAFRVMYLDDGTKNKNRTQYLMTKKKRDHINELLESDGLGSKKVIFHPRPRGHGDVRLSDSRCSTTSDRRVKVEGEFLKNYKSNELSKEQAPIAKLKRWELLLYKKLGFVQAV